MDLTQTIVIEELTHDMKWVAIDVAINDAAMVAADMKRRMIEVLVVVALADLEEERLTPEEELRGLNQGSSAVGGKERGRERAQFNIFQKL